MDVSERDLYVRVVNFKRGAVSTDLRELLQSTLGSNYTLERELGGGGMSHVFVAVDARLGRRVVIKVLRPDLAGDVSAARVEREVRFAARLQHPHVVPLFTAGEAGGLRPLEALGGQRVHARGDRLIHAPLAE